MMTPGNIGSTLSYIVKGANLPNNSTCIQVDCYYNTEYIPINKLMPILRSSNNQPSMSLSQSLSGELSKLIDAGSLIMPNKGDKFGGYAKKAYEVSKQIENFVPGLSAMNSVLGFFV